MKILRFFALSALMIQGIYANSYDKALIEAAGMGDLNKVKSLVAKGANVNARDEYGFTVLMNAVSISNKTREYLESKGIKAYKYIYYDFWEYRRTQESCIKYFNTPFADVSHFGYLDIVKYLVANGADINAKSDNGGTALMFAARDGQLEIVKYLVSKGANVNYTSKHYWTALKTAAGNGQLEVVKYLISKGANIRIKGREDVLIQALIFANNVELVKYLVSKGANVNAKDSSGESILMFARKLETIKYLISVGARVNDADSGGETILLRMAKYGETCGRTVETIEYLISVGANINAKGYMWASADSFHRGVNALMYAAQNSCRADMTDKQKRFVAKNAKNKYATMDKIEYLVSKGLDVNAKDDKGTTALMWHLMYSGGCIGTIKFLVEKGVDINVRNHKGNTALILASKNGASYEVIKYLVEMGANINAKDNEGNTALSVAKDDKIKEFLKSKGAQ